MLPVSLGDLAPLNPAVNAADDAAGWFQPANVASAKNTERRLLIAWLGLFVFFGVVIALGHVWLRLKVVDLGYQLLTTRQLIERLAQEQHELTIEVATLADEFVWVLEDTAAFVGGRAVAAIERYVQGLPPPFAAALARYDREREYSWAAPGHQGGIAFLKSPVGRVFFRGDGQRARRGRCNWPRCD